MATTLTTEHSFTGNGSTTLYSITFTYLKEADVKVTLDHVATTAYSFANASTIQFNTAPANGAQIRIYRDTDVNAARFSFSSGNSLKSGELNENLDQLLYADQELVSEEGLSNESVSTPKIRDLNVTTIKLADLNVTNAKLADNAVALRNMQDNSVDTPEIVDAAVVNSKLATDSVSLAKMQDNSVDTPELVNLSVHTSKINTYAVINSKLATDSVSTIKVQDDAITEPKLGPNSVTNRQIADGSISGAKITDNTLDLQKVIAGDVRTLAEQNTAPNAAGSDDEIGTTSANDKRYDIIYQSGTPSATDFVTGKLWYDHANDQTLYVWDGSNWLGISSGGTFVTQPTVIWVDSVNGLDTNDGHRVIDAMKTIKAAVTSADHGDIVLVAPGIYREIAPIDVTVNNLSIVGQSLRSCFVHPTPATELNSLFRVNSGTQIQNFSFGGLKASGTRGGHAIDSDNTYGLPTNQAFVAEFYPNAVIYKSPYIQNCTNFADSGIFNHTQAEYNANNALGGFFDPNNVTQGGFGGDLTSGPTGGGLLVNGAAVSSNSPLRSMVVDSFTQVTLDGPGILCCNNGYAQLVSFFGTFCHYHAKALNGGQLNLSNCTTDYGRYGLIADGKSPTPNFTAPVSTNASAGDITFTIGAQTAGTGWYGSATRPQDNMSVTIGSNTYPVKSAVANGSGWDVTIENPNPAALATNLGLIAGLTAGDVASFFNRSYISTGGHTFEYVGAGTDYRAAPENGGVPIEANQVKNLNNGKVFQSSTDHNGKFKVGDTFTVDQRTGEVNISLDAYRPELVNDLSPQLGGNLDVNGKNITGTVKLNNLTYPSADGATDQVLKTDGSGNLAFIGINQLSGAGLQNLTDDSTPQLGGNLDVVTYDIVSTSNRDIDLDPNGSGSVVVKGNATRGSGNITLNCENNSHGVKLKGPAHSAGANYTMTLPTALPSSTGQALTSDTNGNLSYFNPVADGSVTTAKIADNAVTGDKLADDIVIAGNLTVNGTTTTVNSTTLTVDDKNIELGSVSTPSDTTADGGGITIKGATDKTLTWENSTSSWTFNQPVVVSPGGTERLRVGPAGQVGIAGANYGTTGQVLTSGGASASPTWGDVGGSPSFEATASGALTDGAAVVINVDGTVSTITGSGSGATLSTDYGANSDESNQIAACYDEANNKVVMVYRAENVSGRLHCVVGEINGTAITWGSRFQIGSSYGAEDISIVYMPDVSRVLTVYRSQQFNQMLYQIGQTSGSGSSSTATFTSPTNFGSNAIGGEAIRTTYDTTANKVVLVYCTGSGSTGSEGKIRAGTPGTSSITWGSEHTYSTGSTNHHQDVEFDPSSDRVFIAYKDASDSQRGKCRIALVQPTNAIAFGSETQFTVGTDSANKPRIAYNSTNNKMAILYLDMNQVNSSNPKAHVTFISIHPTSKLITVGNTFNLDDNIRPGDDDHDFIYSPNGDRYIWNFYDRSNSYYGTYYSFREGAAGLDLDTKVAYQSNSISEPISVYDPDTQNTIFLFRDNTSYFKEGKGKVAKPNTIVTNLQSNNFIGMSAAAYSNGQTATIQLASSVDDAQSGLTPGVLYYLNQNNGSLQTTPDLISSLAGVAVAATKLLIK